jgi:hypothetical protein
MKYDYYAHYVNDETWHFVRVSTDLALTITGQKVFVEDILDKNGPGKVITVRKNSYGNYIGYHLPTPHVLTDVNDGYNWEARVWRNALELNHVRTILNQSFWKRIEADGSILSFRFADTLIVNNLPLDVSYDIIIEEEEIWIVSGETKYKILDINPNQMTLQLGKSIFILTKQS